MTATGRARVGVNRMYCTVHTYCTKGDSDGGAQA